MSKTNAKIALNKKLRLERLLYTRVAAIFKDIAAKSSGPFFNPGVYESQIERVLVDHYARVFNEFGDDYRQLKKITLPLVASIALNDSAEKIFAKHAKKQARIITNTNNRQLTKIKTIANEQMSEMLKINPNLSYSTHLTNLYSAALLRRVGPISIYETQWSAEFSKAHEANFIAIGVGVHTKAEKITNIKRWDAMGDDLMRDWHADADSTEVPIDEPFNVNGEELMYPGDDSLGATASNLINCRCTVSYELWYPEEVDLTKFPELGEAVQKWKDVGKGNPVGPDGTILATAKDVKSTNSAIEKALNDAKSWGPEAKEKAKLLKEAWDAQQKLFVEGQTSRKEIVYFWEQAKKISKGDAAYIKMDVLKSKYVELMNKVPAKVVSPKPVVTTQNPTKVIPTKPQVEYLTPIDDVPPAKLTPTSQTVLDDIAASFGGSAVSVSEVSEQTGKIAYATYQYVQQTKGIIAKAYKAAKASGIQANIDAVSQLVADFGTASASFKPGITPRKIFSSMGTLAKKITVASNNGEAFVLGKKVTGAIKPTKPVMPSFTDQGYKKYTSLPDESNTKPFATAKMKAEVDKVWAERYRSADSKYGVSDYVLPVIDRHEYEAIESYKRTSSAINAYQRNGSLGYYSSTSDKQKIERTIDAIHNVIRRSEVLDDQIVYRGINDYEIAMQMRKLNIGDKIPNTSTTSTSVQKSVASSFSSGMLMEIELPAGTRALYVDPVIRVNGYTGSHAHEYEVILPRGGYYEVVEKTPTRTKFRYHAPKTFSDPQTRDKVLEIPTEFVVTQQDASRLTLCAQEFYAMLVLGGFTTLADELVEAYSAKK